MRVFLSILFSMAVLAVLVLELVRGEESEMSRRRKHCEGCGLLKRVSKVKGRLLCKKCRLEGGGE
jgi:hypothetical protein